MWHQTSKDNVHSKWSLIHYDSPEMAGRYPRSNQGLLAAHILKGLAPNPAWCCVVSLLVLANDNKANNLLIDFKTSPFPKGKFFLTKRLAIDIL